MVSDVFYPASSLGFYLSFRRIQWIRFIDRVGWRKLENRGRNIVPVSGFFELHDYCRNGMVVEGLETVTTGDFPAWVYFFDFMVEIIFLLSK